MKKLFLIILFFICLKSFGQTFPVTQNIGAKTTIVNTAGAFRTTTGFIYQNFSDTSEANIPDYLRFTPSAVILTGYQDLWVRNSTANAWIKISGGGGSGSTITSLGGGFPVGITGTNDTRTVNGANGLFPDSTTTSNVVTFNLGATSLALAANKPFTSDRFIQAGSTNVYALSMVRDISVFGPPYTSFPYTYTEFTRPTVINLKGVDGGTLNFTVFDSTCVVGSSFPGLGWYAGYNQTLQAVGPILHWTATDKHYDIVDVRSATGSLTYADIQFNGFSTIDWRPTGETYLGLIGTHRVGINRGLGALGAMFDVNGTSKFADSMFLFSRTGTTSDSVYTKRSDGSLGAIAQSSLIGVNIYNSDGTISAARTADGNNIGSLFWTNFADYYITIQTGTGHEFVVQKAGIDRFRADNSNTRVNSPDGASSQLNVTNGQAYYTSQNQLYLAGVANTFLYGGDSLISGSGGTYPTSASGVNMYPTKLRMFATSSQDQYAGDSLVWRMTDRSSAFTLLANTAETYAGQNEISLVNPTGITLQPYKQNLYIDSLQHTLTATAKMVTWDSVTGRIETRAIPTGTSGLTVGTTTITSGTTTRILYDNAGVLGEYTVTGSGTTAVLSTTPTFTTSIIAPLHIGSTSADGTVTLQGNNAGAGNTATSQNIIMSVGNTPTKFFDILNNGTVRIGSGNTTTSGFGLVVDQPDDGTDLKGIRVSSNNHTATLDIGYDKIQTSGANKIGTASGGVQLYGASGASVNISTSAAVPTSTLTVDGSIGWKLSSSAIDVTLTAVMSTMLLTATGKTATLPTAAGITGRVYTIKLTASGTGTVATTSSQTIDGSTTYSLSAQYKYVMVQSDGSNWNIIANN